MNLVEWCIDNFPCGSHVKEKNGFKGLRDLSNSCICYIIHYLKRHEPVSHQKLRERLLLSKSHQCLMQISKFPANFPWKGLLVLMVHGKFCSRLPSCEVPEALTSVARTSWLKGLLGLPGPTLVSKAGLSPVSGCWFYLSSVSWICENSFFLFLFLAGCP